jgi:hypothetical protein
MHRFLLGLVAALAAVGGAPFLKAQSFPPDPLGKRHPTGYNHNVDPALLSRVPMEGEFRAFLPPSVDLSSHMPPPGDQGDAGTCSGFATVYGARSYYVAMLEGRDLSDTRNVPSPGYVMSFIKGYCCSNMYDVADVLKKGAVSIADYPYTENGKPPPSREIVAKAHDFQVRGTRRVNFNRLDDIKGQLARGNPVIFALWTDDAFQDYRGGTVFNARGRQTDDWHSIVVVGYDDRRQAFRLMNSWGVGWGDNGYMWLSYDLVKLRVDDAGVLDVAPPRRRPVPPAPQPKIVQPVPAPVPPAPIPPAPQPKNVVVLPAPPAPPAPTPLPPAPAPVPPAPTPLPPAPTPAPDGFAFLQNLACARVNVLTQDNRYVLSGFVGSDDDLRQVRQAAAAIPNTTVGEILVAPWPQCEALLTLETPLATADPPLIAINVMNASREVREGDPLPITIQSPSQVSYLYISYIQADGSVVNLAQPEGLVPKPTLPGTVLTFGDGREGRAKFTVSPPFGREMIIALASRSPLFDQPLPGQQHEREYLTALRRALIYKPSPDLPDREVTAAMQTLTTRAR